MANEKRLYRSNDAKVAGVCGGLAEYFDIDPSLVRIGYTVFTLCSVGLGLVCYVAMMLIIPKK